MASGARTRPLRTGNFAPTNPSALSSPAAGLQALEASNAAMRLALRSVGLKLDIVELDVRSRVGKNEVGIDDLLDTHDSISAQLEVVLREWEAGRLALRAALGRAQAKAAPASPIRRWDEPEEEQPEAELELEAEGEEAEFAAEGEGPEEAGARAAMDDAASSAYLAPPGNELVFEAVVGDSSEGRRQRAKLSREERIAQMKERRDAAAAGAENGPTEGGMGPGGGSRMVEELKDVLQLLKLKNQIPREQ